MADKITLLKREDCMGLIVSIEKISEQQYSLQFKNKPPKYIAQVSSVRIIEKQRSLKLDGRIMAVADEVQYKVTSIREFVGTSLNL